MKFIKYLIIHTAGLLPEATVILFFTTFKFAINSAIFII